MQLYKGLLESSLRFNWDRPKDMDDHTNVAEVEVAVDKTGEDHQSGLEEKIRSKAMGRIRALGHRQHQESEPSAAHQLPSPRGGSFRR